MKMSAVLGQNTSTDIIKLDYYYSTLPKSKYQAQQ